MKLRVLGAIMATSLLLAACSDHEPGQPTAPADPGGGEPTVGAPSGTKTMPAVPKVANPVTNLKTFQQDPCTMLTKGQAKKLGFAAKIFPDDNLKEFGPACQWQNAHGDYVSVLLHVDQPLGIGGIYRNHYQTTPYAYFEPVDITGFPGVFSAEVDQRPDGSCNMAVGVTDTQIIGLRNRVDDTPGAGDVCEILKQAAAAAVSTMSKG